MIDIDVDSNASAFIKLKLLALFTIRVTSLSFLYRNLVIIEVLERIVGNLFITILRVSLLEIYLSINFTGHTFLAILRLHGRRLLIGHASNWSKPFLT